MYRKCNASAIVGIDAVRVDVESNITPGLGMFLVGLPDSAVRESQERIRSAFINSEYKMPGKKVVVNLAPADLRKEGSALDLPIAIAILAASEQISADLLEEFVIMGELSLDGSVKAIKGALPMAVMARQEGFKGIILPAANAPEAAVVEGLEVFGVGTLREATALLSGMLPESVKPEQRGDGGEVNLYAEDFADVKGQSAARRAMEVAAAGGHNIMMIGAPGSGKTMLARRMPTIMPPLSLEEALETTKIHSVAGKSESQGLIEKRPFRAPHHMASPVSLVGGGSSPQPGEISLAHNGILFLDELPEFGRSVLEVLRQPMEEKRVVVSRAKYSVEYPANFTLVAAMNPCPCGFYNHPTKDCVCTQGEVFRYLNRISGPMLDRIDLQIEVAPVPFEEISDNQPTECSATIRERVVAARERQRERFSGIEGVYTNAMMNSAMIKEFCPLSPECTSLLGRAMQRLNLSARAYDRIIKVARTIADLAGAESIEPSHIAEAISYRTLDRGNWGR